MTALVTVTEAKARRRVRLTDGREGVLTFFRPSTERRSARVRVRISNRHFDLPAEAVDAVLDEQGAVPAWVTHERLLALTRLAREAGRADPHEVVTVQAHSPQRDETCRACGHYWPCASAAEVGDRAGFIWD